MRMKLVSSMTGGENAETVNSGRNLEKCCWNAPSLSSNTWHFPDLVCQDGSVTAVLIDALKRQQPLRACSALQMPREG